MNRTPRIEKTSEIKLIGKKIRMSLAENQTRPLWESFMPRKKRISNTDGIEFYSVESYDDLGFFEKFDPAKEFEKWVAVKVTNFDNVPEDMEAFLIPAGLYAVFQYKGRPSEAQPTYQYIYSKWVPNSEYSLDHRPHFALMGEKYKGEDPESEEELWIPIRSRNDEKR